MATGKRNSEVRSGDQGAVKGVGVILNKRIQSNQVSLNLFLLRFALVFYNPRLLFKNT